MSPATLLIVEDQAVIAEDLKCRLIRNGYTVCGVAASGEEALELARRHRPGLALMDIRLQGSMDGIDTADVLRREIGVPVIFLSSHSDESTLERAKGAAPYGFLIKPFEERELQLNIEVALHKHEGERNLAAAHEEIRKLNDTLEERVRDRTAELETALTEIEGFAHAVAHHLRSPLRAMEGYSSLLQAEQVAGLSDEASRFLGAIGGNAARMARMVDDLLSFLDLRQRASRPRRVDITAAAREILAELAAADPGRRPVEVQVDEMPGCHVDPALLRQLLAELFSNALKFSRDSHPAIISVGARPGTDPAGRHVYFVRDNGIGIDARYAGEIFNLFSRLNRTEDYEGSGAGLAKARRIVERHRGEIWAEPVPGGGTSFFFSLPERP